MPPITLSDYDVDTRTGFLPSPDPLKALPAAYAIWDELGRELPALLLMGRLRAWIERMPLLDQAPLTQRHEAERALMLLTTAVSAYVWADPTQPATIVPRNLAVPLWQLSMRMGRKPIIAHAANVLFNWRRIDPAGGFELENLATLQPFLGSSDESWFVLVTVAIEAAGAKALPLLVRAREIIDTNSDSASEQNKLTDELEQLLSRIGDVIAELSQILMRMYEKCDPHIFYSRVRPYLASWPAPGVIYQGVDDQPRIFAGGSAGQSSLIHSLDAALGVRHTSEHSRHFFIAMRDYMPPAHRRFVMALEQGTNMHDYVMAQQLCAPTLARSYNACIEQLTDFRKKHMEVAVRYISMQAPKNVAAVGTGGTNLAQMLGAAKRQTSEHVIERTAS